MNAKTKAQWLAALRSGKYEQGKNKLRRGGSSEFCCLGVLCDISGLGEWDGSVFTNKDRRQDRVRFWESSLLPQEVADKLGLHFSPRIKVAALSDVDLAMVKLNIQGIQCIDSTEYLALDWLNDRGLSFAQIADLIEKYIPADEPKQETN